MRRRAALISGLLWLSVSGCGQHPDGARVVPGHSDVVVTRPLVELFSWWTARGEAEALQALIDTHKRAHPTARLFNAAAASGSKARESLSERIASGQPPDMFQQNAHDLRAFVGKHPGQLLPLDELFDGLDLGQSVYPEVIRDVTLGGHIYAMPVNIHRENTLFFNRRLLAAHGIAPPSSFEDLLAACQRLKERGVVPLATSHQGWILRILFNSIAMGRLGSEQYYRYFTGDLPADDPGLREAIRVFAEVLENYVNPDAGEEGFGWTSAAQAVYTGDAAMFLHGDWAKGYFAQLGWKPGVDFGAVGAPGAEGLFLYGVDTFSLPRCAPNTAGAKALLRTIASTEGQVAFNNLKGSSPIRSDVAAADLDAVARVTAADLQQASRRMLVRGREAWDEALAQFAKDRDQEKLFQAYVQNPP